MAIYNEILSARFSRLVQKLFSMKGPAAVRQVSGELQSVLPFFNGAENRFLEGWQRYGINFNQAAVAGNQGGIRFRNPLGLGVVAVFEKLWALNSVADNPSFTLGPTNTDLGTVVNPGTAITRFDARGSQTPVVIVSHASPFTGVGGLNFAQVAFPANGQADLILTENQEITLLPGDALQANSNVANQALIIGAWWRERPLEESEKQF